MGALDKRIFSGVAILSTLLFVVSAVMLLANGGEVTDDANDIALYIVTVAGVLAIVYSVTLMTDRSSFVRTMSGVFTAIAGIMFVAVPFVGENTAILLAAASVVAAIAIVFDMLALWVSRIYGAMYVAAVLAAVDLAMGVIYFADSSQTYYHAIALIAFGIWLALSAYVIGFVKVEPVARTREVKEDKQSSKSSKPQAKNTKATKKAKKPEKKPEPKVAEQPEKEAQGETPKAGSKAKEEPKEAPKAIPKEESRKEEPKEERPKQRPVPRPVTLPNRPKVEEEPKEAPKAIPKEEPRKEESKPVESADGQKPPAKSMNDFMKKLMSSENANRVKHDAPKETPKEEPAVVEPEPIEAAELPETKETVLDVVADSDLIDAEESEAIIDEPVEEEFVFEDAIIREPEVEEPETPVDEIEVISEAGQVDEEPVTEVPTEVEPVVETVVEPSEEVPEAEVAVAEEYEVIIDEPVAEEPVLEEATVEEPVTEVPTEVEPVAETVIVEEPVVEGTYDSAPEAGSETEAEPQPDWGMVSHDAAQADDSEESSEEIDEEPVAETVIVEEPVVEDTYDSAPEADVTVAEEDVPASSIEQGPEPIPEPEPESQPIIAEQPVSEPASVTGEMDIEAGEEVLGEDLYTDYSPEAVVRRAAWNKGLRCRRGYGPYNIPVAFVKGKVAVYVDDGDVDTSTDSVLRDQGWTVLRYDASTITDGKAQGDEIAAAVKSNLRSAKAAAKKKSKK